MGTCKTCKFWDSDMFCDNVGEVSEGPKRFELFVRVLDDSGLDAKLLTAQILDASFTPTEPTT